MPQVSAELRWFLASQHQALASAFGDWFESGKKKAGGSRDKTRKDVYALDQTLELGVKDREGKEGLEVKVLVTDSAAQLRLGTRDATVQIWSKVTSQVLALPSGPNASRVVLKKRRLRKFDTMNAIQEVELDEKENPIAGDKPKAGCNVEWTEIAVPGSPVCWSFGLEAFSFVPGVDHRAVLVEALRTTLAALDALLPGRPELGEQWLEQSYPAWLMGG